MAQYSCKFSIPAGSTGGKLSGGFVGGTPSLVANDRIIVSVVYPSTSGNPATLDGAFVFSAAPDAPSSQTTATPFVWSYNNAFLCFYAPVANPVTVGNTVVYTFPALDYLGGLPGNYELTFVAINNNVNPPQQWSEDPEFDTSS